LKGVDAVKNRIVIISLTVVLALGVSLIGCTTEYVPEITEYDLTISSTEGGSVTTPGQGTESFTYDEGTVVDVVAEPDKGYRFENWTGNVGSIANVNAASTTITMNGNYSIMANFIAQCVLTIDSTQGGLVTSPGEGTFTYDEGTRVRLVAVTEVDYRFEEWIGDAGTIVDVRSRDTIVTMNADYVITASFGYPTTQRATILVDGNPGDWSSLEPALVDPQGDCICDADDDVKHIYTAMDDSYAYVMVETYGLPIDRSAVIEMNFDYKVGEHFLHDPEHRDDLHTGVSSSGFGASNDNDLDRILESYPINGYVVVWGDVMELKIPLSQLENAAWFNPTFVNAWDESYELDLHGCDPSTVFSGNWN
jgi:hypothetical protein